MADIDSLVFGGWDVFPEDGYDSAIHAGVLDQRLLDQIADPLKAVKPMPAVFDRNYVRRLEGSNVKSAKSKWDAVLEVREDISALQGRQRRRAAGDDLVRQHRGFHAAPRSTQRD